MDQIELMDHCKIFAFTISRMKSALNRHVVGKGMEQRD